MSIRYTEEREAQNMSEKDKKDIEEMVKTAKELAERDPHGFMLAKNSMDILKARSDMEKAEKTGGDNCENNSRIK